MAHAANCDVWYFKYWDAAGDWSKEDMLKQQPFFGQFKAVTTGNLWGCNTACSDFFDVTPFRPDSLLKSLKNKDERWFLKLR